MSDGVGLSVGASNLAAVLVGRAAVSRTPVLTRYPHRPPEVGVPSENPNLKERGLILTDFVDRVGDPVGIVAADGSTHRADGVLADALRAMLHAVGGACHPPKPTAVTYPAHWRPGAVDAAAQCIGRGARVPNERDPGDRSSPTPWPRSRRCRRPGCADAAASSRCAISAAPAPASRWSTPPAVTRRSAPTVRAHRPLRRPHRSGAVDPRASTTCRRRAPSTCPARRRSVRSPGCGPSAAAPRSGCPQSARHLAGRRVARASQRRAADAQRVRRRDPRSRSADFVGVVQETLERNGVRGLVAVGIPVGGGASRSPFITTTLSERFRVPVITSGQPEMTAAIGWRPWRLCAVWSSIRQTSNAADAPVCRLQPRRRWPEVARRPGRDDAIGYVRALAWSDADDVPDVAPTDPYDYSSPADPGGVRPTCGPQMQFQHDPQEH